MQHRPKKRFGQNFLEDQNIIHQIIQAIAPQGSDNLLEIGPGLGALTRPLLKSVPHMKVVEIDTDIHAHIQTWPEYHNQQLTLIPKDALSVDYDAWGDSLRVVGNLPYNISTPLLFHILSYAPSIKDMHFMLQKEVVDRLSASPNTKTYGKLTIMAQALCQVEALFTVPPHAFKPAPKVDSAIVRLTPLKERPSIVELKLLGALLTEAFSKRRKTLNNSLKHVPQEAFTTLNIDPKLRIENLSVKTCIELARYLANL